MADRGAGSSDLSDLLTADFAAFSVDELTAIGNRVREAPLSPVRTIVVNRLLAHANVRLEQVQREGYMARRRVIHCRMATEPLRARIATLKAKLGESGD